MNQYYTCAHCGAENEIEIELAAGDRQRLTGVCDDCGRASTIVAHFNYAVSEFELELSPEDDG